MLIQCWAIVYNAGTTLAQHWVDVSCLLGINHSAHCKAKTQYLFTSKVSRCCLFMLVFARQLQWACTWRTACWSCIGLYTQQTRSLTQCCSNVSLPSSTSAQLKNNIRSMPRVSCVHVRRQPLSLAGLLHIYKHHNWSTVAYMYVCCPLLGKHNTIMLGQRCRCSVNTTHGQCVVFAIAAE